MHTRRTFFRYSAALIASGLASKLSIAQTSRSKNTKGIPPKPPALDPRKVKAIVGMAHGNLNKVRSLVSETPLLVNACWDWGGGDFETPLQAAAHMGRRDIAEYLLSHQARFDIFAAAMLGQLEVVKTVLSPDPVNLAAVPGPHGLTLLHCAKKGGAEAQPVYDWLLDQGVPQVLSRPLPFVWPDGSAPHRE